MKVFAYLALLLALLMAVSAEEATIGAMPGREGGLIEWRKPGRDTAQFTAAQAEAKARKVPILAFFTCGCEECQSLWPKHFSDPKALALSRGMIPMLIKGNADLVRKYKVGDCPQVIVFSATGTELANWPETKLLAMSGADFAAALAKVVPKK
jgi:hypothetical protein